MLSFLLIFSGIAILCFVLLRVFLNSSPARIRKLLTWAIGSILLALVVFFLYRTSGSFLWTLLFVLLPLFMRLKGIVQQIRNFTKTARGPSEGQNSSVQTSFLEMSLDHDSGRMTGSVKKGRFAGNQLEELNLEQLIQLLDEAAGDPKTVALLENFLEINYGADWGNQKDTNESNMYSNTKGAQNRVPLLDTS